MRTLILTAVVALAASLGLAPSALAKPDGGRMVVYPFAGYPMFADGSNLENSLMYGLGFGLMPSSHLALEGIYGYTSTKFRDFVPDVSGDVAVRQLGADLRIHPLGQRRINPYLVAGWTQLRYRPDASGKSIDYDGWEAGLGLVVALLESANWRLALRADARDVMVKFDQEPAVDVDGFRHNLAFLGGIQIEVGDDWHKDSDRDGIIDRMDDCPDTDTRIVVDARGCPIDSDADGIFDGLDQCADTPAGAVVDSLGCPIDSDADGVYDGLDQCPDTPAGAVIDAEGCPVDSDGDGVFDGLDMCPQTPQGVRVDEQGCPTVDSAQEQQLYDTGLLVLEGVEFESGEAELTPLSRNRLGFIGNILRKWPDLKLEIGGHTDDRGSEARNLELSQERADAVRTHLLEEFDFVTEDRLIAVGYGPSQPIADNATEEGRNQNRRVELRVLEGGPTSR
ncbi:MAG: OmpA family protein [Deltaproteobacteria bacterium]|nr:OmpA family protein [Deltaproteobacteria bacterium]